MFETAPSCRSGSPSARSGIGRALASARGLAILALVIAALLSATGTMRDAAREPVEVSVRDVVIDPYTVDGKLVRLYGSLHLRRDGDARYWLEADNKPSGESRAVTVHYSSPAPQPDDAANGSYVALEGIFYAAKPKRRGWRWEPAAPGARFEGALVNARRVQTR